MGRRARCLRRPGRLPRGQVAKISEQLEEKDAELSTVQRSREDMAVALAEEKHAARLHVVELQALEDRVASLESSLTSAEVAKATAERRAQALLADNRDLQQRVAAAERVRDTATAQVAELKVRSRRGRCAVPRL